MAHIRTMGAATLGLLLAACSAAPPSPASVHNPAPYVEDGPYEPTFDPESFVDGIDNPYLPWTPGTTLIYEGGDQRVEVTVTNETREILGITAVVVHDQVFVGDELIEDTYDWYAQDAAGNVWYLGEDTKEYENGGVVSTEGSWEAGVDGAEPGIIMLADPQVGDAYRQEFYQGEAEDVAKVLALGESVEVPSGTHEDVLVTEGWSLLDPDVIAHKFYAPGIGVVREELGQGGDQVLELVEIPSS